MSPTTNKLFQELSRRCNKSLKIPKGESDPHIEEEQTTQWPNKSNM
jgi:hypothetical protein